MKKSSSPDDPWGLGHAPEMAPGVPTADDPWGMGKQPEMDPESAVVATSGAHTDEAAEEEPCADEDPWGMGKAPVVAKGVHSCSTSPRDAKPLRSSGRDKSPRKVRKATQREEDEDDRLRVTNVTLDRVVTGEEKINLYHWSVELSNGGRRQVTKTYHEMLSLPRLIATLSITPLLPPLPGLDMDRALVSFNDDASADAESYEQAIISCWHAYVRSLIMLGKEVAGSLLETFFRLRKLPRVFVADKRTKPSPGTRILDVVVVEARELALKQSSGRGSKAGGKQYCSTFAVLCTQDQRYATQRVRERDPVWNEEVTFTLDESTDVLSVCMFSVSGRGKKPSFLGITNINLTKLEVGKVYGEWYNLLGMPPNMTCNGQLYFLMQMSETAEDGLLAEKGVPLQCLPIRVAPGDMLFFNNRTLVSHLAKVATSSKWDHAAIVMPHTSGELKLLEAVSDGVLMMGLERGMRANMDTCRLLGIRRIHMNRSSDVLERLADLGQQLRGRSYNFNVMTMLRKQKTGSDKHDEVLRSGKMFCSQLVAVCLIAIGVLPPDNASTNYLPATLASSHLVAMPGVRIQPLIEFDTQGVLKKEEAVIQRLTKAEQERKAMRMEWEESHKHIVEEQRAMLQLILEEKAAMMDSPEDEASGSEPGATTKADSPASGAPKEDSPEDGDAASSGAPEDEASGDAASSGAPEGDPPEDEASSGEPRPVSVSPESPQVWRLQGDAATRPVSPGTPTIGRRHRSLAHSASDACSPLRTGSSPKSVSAVPARIPGTRPRSVTYVSHERTCALPRGALTRVGSRRFTLRPEHDVRDLVSQGMSQEDAQIKLSQQETVEFALRMWMGLKSDDSSDELHDGDDDGSNGDDGDGDDA